MDKEMTSKILKSKTAVKMFSIFLGILLWFTVLNTTNPTSTKIITIPITLTDINAFYDRGFGIKNADYERDVTLVIEGRKNDLSMLTEKDFSASVDMNSITTEGTHTLKVNIDAPEDSYYFIRATNPQRIRLDVEMTVEKVFSVEIVLEGNAKENIAVIESSAFPGDIAISSLRSVVSSIGRVVAYIDINDIDRNITFRKFCNVYNINGVEMTEFKDKFSVEARIRVAKRVPVIPIVTGKPGNGAFESTRQVYPEEVYITGSVDALSRIDQIMTTPVDITGISAGASFQTMLVLPEGVQLYNSPAEATVTIGVETVEEDKIVITADEINIKGKIDKYNYRIFTPSVEVVIKGLRRDLDAINVSMLTPEINAELLKEGTHRLAVELRPPEGITVIGSYFVEVVIAEVEPSEKTPEVTPTPSPTTTPDT